MTQLTLTGEESDGRDELREAEPKVWDDGSVTPMWHCPDCDLGICAESVCPECGWFDADRWAATLNGGGRVAE